MKLEMVNAIRDALLPQKIISVMPKVICDGVSG